jgi:hypothetical protein
MVGSPDGGAPVFASASDIMAVTVETLDKLERKMTLTLPVNAIQSEVDSRLKKLARTVKMDGFRPGKVPMSSWPSATATRCSTR